MPKKYKIYKFSHYDDLKYYLGNTTIPFANIAQYNDPFEGKMLFVVHRRIAKFGVAVHNKYIINMKDLMDKKRYWKKNLL